MTLGKPFEHLHIPGVVSWKLYVYEEGAWHGISNMDIGLDYGLMIG